MSALGSLVVKLALEYAEYTRGLDRSDQAGLEFAQRAQRHFDQAARAGSDFFGGIVKRAAGAAAAYMTVSTAIDTVNRSLNSLAALDDMNQKTGASVENLSRLQQVASSFGHDFDGAISGALTKLTKGMASVDDDSNKVGKALKALGLNAKDAAGNLRDPAEVMVDVSKKLATYQDGAAKAALVTDLFGKAGADLLPYMNDVADSVDKFTGVSAEAAAEASQFQDQVNALQTQFNTLVTHLVGEALPAMNDLVGAFTDALNESDKLNGGEVGAWTEDLAVGLARVVDVAMLLPRLLRAVGGSAEVVAADVTFLGKAASLANPIALIKAQFEGRSVNDELRAAADERNKILAAANERYRKLWYDPANLVEQGVLARIKARKEAGPDEAGKPATSRGSLKYDSGGSEKEKNDYDSLNKTIQARLAMADEELRVGRSLNDAEKEMATIQRGRAEGTIHLTDEEAKRLQKSLEMLEVDRRVIASRNDIAKLNKDLADEEQKQVDTATAEAKQNEALADAFGKTKAQIEAMSLARLEDQLAQRATTGMTLDEIEHLEKLIAAKKRSATALSRAEELGTAQKSLDELNDFLDPAKAQTFGAALKEAFGSAGDSISKVSGVLDSMGRKQAEISKQKAGAAHGLLTGLLDEKKYTEDLAKLNEQETKNRLSGYGDLASATAGFFGEQSRGYQALSAISKAFHAAELAMSLAELVPKGIAAVLNQANGDPYSAFARMAAMAAVVAGLGVMIGGVNGGGNVAKQRQEAAGTGSVLGDANAKSESISRSLDVIEKNSGIELSHTAGMLRSLRSIENSLDGLGSLLVRNSELTGNLAPGAAGGAADFFSSTAGSYVMHGMFTPLFLAADKLVGGALSKFDGKIGNAIFGGKVSTLDTGVTIDKISLESVLAQGVHASQYTDIKKDGGLFHSDKTSTQYKDLGAEADDQFTKVILGLYSTVNEAATLLGLGGTEFANRLNNFVVDVGKISLKDMDGDQIQKALESIFSKVGDDMAQFGVAGLADFQQVGEGYLETLTRIAANYANLDSVLATVGKTFGAVGMESIAARENLIALVGGIDKLAEYTSSFAENYLTEAERLAPVQQYVAEQLGKMGLASLQSRDQFKDYVLALDLTTQAGRDQYAALMSLESAFAKVYPAMNETATAAEILADKKRLEAQIYDLTHTAAEATARQRKEELAAMDASLRPLQERVWALQDEAAAVDLLVESAANLDRVIQLEKDKLTEAHQVAMDALQERIAAEEKSVAKLQSLAQLLHSTIDQLVVPGRAREERLSAQAEIRSALAIAKAGGPLPESDAIKSALSTVSKDASGQFANYVDYLRDAYRTANDIKQLSDLTDGQLSVEERVLKSLNDQKDSATKAYDAEIKRLDDISKAANLQIELLRGNNASLQSVAQALNAFYGQLNNVKITQAYETYLGRSPDAAGLDFYNNWASSGGSMDAITDSIKNSAEANIRALYSSVLGRAADAAGLSFYIDSMKSGATLDDIRQSMLSSDEYKNKIPAFAAGGDHLGGVRLVGERGPELEVTGPSRIFNASQTAEILRGGGGGSELASEVRQLAVEVGKLLKPTSDAAEASQRAASILVRVTRNGDYMITKGVA